MQTHRQKAWSTAIRCRGFGVGTQFAAAAATWGGATAWGSDAVDGGIAGDVEGRGVGGFLFLFGGGGVFEAFGVVGPGGLDLVEGHGDAFFEFGGEGFEAVEAVFDGSHVCCGEGM